MRRLLPLLLVALGGLVAGVTITGFPSDVPNDVTSDGLTATGEGPGTASAAADTPPTTTTTTTMQPVQSTLGSSDPPRPTLTSLQPSSAPSIATTSTSTSPATANTGSDKLVVVVANAGPADGLAALTAAAINALGYVDTVVTTAAARRLVSEVYFAPGRGEDGLVLAGAMGLAATQVLPSPDTPLTLDDARGDLWLIVGNDLAQRFEVGG